MNWWFCLKGEVLLQALPLMFAMFAMSSQFVGNPKLFWCHCHTDPASPCVLFPCQRANWAGAKTSSCGKRTRSFLIRFQDEASFPCCLRDVCCGHKTWCVQAKQHDNHPERMSKHPASDETRSCSQKLQFLNRISFKEELPVLPPSANWGLHRKEVGGVQVRQT